MDPDQLSRAFADSLVSSRGPTRLHDVVGVEHEFRVLRGGEQVPFQPLLARLDLGQWHLEPSDPNAHPLASGASLTADGREAEISLPPVAIARGFATVASRVAELERHRLSEVLGDAFALDGYSTHLSVATPSQLGEQVATEFAARFAVPMMLLVDRADSPGLLVRPRPGRTELGGEYISGRPLANALVFAVAAVRWCVRTVSTDRWRSDRGGPPIIHARVVPDPERFGWYVDRRAFGCDLYANGRDAMLRTLDGRALRAQAVLESAWDAVREEVAGLVTDDEAASVDAVVRGRTPIPSEIVSDARLTHPAVVAAVSEVTAEFGHPSQFRPRRRVSAAIEIAPVMVTWETVVFMVVDDARSRGAFCVVPRPLLALFLERFDDGQLDDLLSSYLRCTRGDRVISSYEQTKWPTLCDGLTSRRDLLAPERDPAEQLAYSVG